VRTKSSAADEVARMLLAADIRMYRERLSRALATEPIAEIVPGIGLDALLEVVTRHE
jgi:hypothetical protein